MLRSGYKKILALAICIMILGALVACSQEQPEPEDVGGNFCSFFTCSNKCGNNQFCDLHDTEEKRYNSLSNSEKKSICNYIDERYDYYDGINGGYAGDKFSDTIFREASFKYDISTSHLNTIWMMYYEY